MKYDPTWDYDYTSTNQNQTSTNKLTSAVKDYEVRKTTIEEFQKWLRKKLVLHAEVTARLWVRFQVFIPVLKTQKWLLRIQYNGIADNTLPRLPLFHLPGNSLQPQTHTHSYASKIELQAARHAACLVTFLPHLLEWWLLWEHWAVIVPRPLLPELPVQWGDWAFLEELTV